jgi:hypothetical protein
MSLTVNVGISFQDSLISESFAATQTASLSLSGYKVQVPTLDTASTQISTATLNSLGYAYLRSLVTTTQATCTITVGRLDGTAMVDMVQLRPREVATLRLAPGDYAARAADSGYRLQFAVFEE